ncbi:MULTISPECIES: hypothetical protein [Sorangium]|uniref:hypothetical protein n=1 Tax=Sorangium TaxID=39643 RepID=UPI003D9C4168
MASVFHQLILSRHIALRMPDGQVMVAGGSGDYPYPTRVDFYNPDTDSWTTGDALPYPMSPVGPAPSRRSTRPGRRASCPRGGASGSPRSASRHCRPPQGRRAPTGSR